MSKLKEERPRGVRSAPFMAAIALMCLSLAVAGGPALAKQFNGGKRADKIKGTKGADKIKGKGGNDKLRGMGGKDVVNGGKGRDAVIGGKGPDRLKAADGRRDKAINGGPGKDVCVIDTALELAITKSCATVIDGGKTGPGTGNALTVQNATGLSCKPLVLGCPFLIQGDGADAATGTVTGGGGVNSVVGTAAAVPQGTEWAATGTYSCTGPGYLRVTIGTKSVDVPTTCP